MNRKGKETPGRTENDVPVHSFDVFDTVLTRTVSPPSEVFFLTGKYARKTLPDRCPPRQFANVRQRAEERAIAWHRDEASLRDIYVEVQSSLQLTDAQAREIKEAELSMEDAVLYAIPETRARIQTLREGGKGIVFVSDMYASTGRIRGWLVERGIWEPGDQLFVSNEYGATKHNGALFRPAQRELSDSRILVHVGNNRKADVEGAEAAGISSRHATAGNPNRYEQILESYAEETSGMSGRMAGASRYARLHTQAESAREEALRNVTAGVMAPTLVGFVAWLLTVAQKEKLDRLHFTSRDGYHLLPIARRLAPLMDVNCEFNYLYVSRAAVSTANPDPEKIERTWAPDERAGGEELLARMGLKMDDIEEHVSSSEEKEEIMTKPISDSGKKILKRCLKKVEDGEITNENRGILRSYLVENGFGGSSKNGIVDVGWQGTVHEFLNDVMLEEEISKRPVCGIFWGLYGDQKDYASSRVAYFFDKYRGIGHRNTLPGVTITTVMETFCTAGHGTVTGYTEENGRVAPVLESSWPERMEAWGLPVVEETLNAFLDGLTDEEEFDSYGADVRDPVAELLRTFWTNPTREEAEAWGTFPFELGQGEGWVRPIAKPFEGWTAPFEFAWYGKEAVEDWNTWLEGALVRSPPVSRWGVRLALRARKTAKYLLFGVAGKLGVADHLGRLIMKWRGHPGRSS